MTGQRIDFVSVDAARFNALRDEWRSAAASRALSRSAMRIATVLPTYVNREFGYAFPTDDDLRGDLQASRETIKRGLKDLEMADLIERHTIVKRDQKSEASGKLRRIFLTMPEVKGQKAVEVKGQEVKGQPEVKGQKRVGDGSYGGPNIPDRTTPDSKIRSGEKTLGDHTHARDQSERADPSPDPSATRRPDPSPPPSWGGDHDFLDAFDRTVRDLMRDGEIGAGAIERFTQQAFDAATGSQDDFMPVHWRDLLACRTYSTAEWFRHRAAAIIHRRQAA
ncbi:MULTISPECIES: hypothetical protein [unclassified Aureimonas]|uniref:hypothetical protein n=1 Tax=unclassified Aureimonas TaxID=2615206 RepID=UPI000700AB3A|nr:MULTISPECIES: hypothetical protein [unclassified Aureimonas]KQT60375.1 hypothetical protein ASG62_06875 [Aureimonas sp. Leaf427]KQT79253.1 hypothetical protein ASG54_09475 [Aureimonas sp. Leaf460]